MAAGTMRTNLTGDLRERTSEDELIRQWNQFEQVIVPRAGCRLIYPTWPYTAIMRAG